MNKGINPSLFIFCGEHSGDLHGTKLVQSLKKNSPSLQIKAVAGPLMRSEGVDTLLKMEQFAVMGFTDVFLALPRLIGLFKQVRDSILINQPIKVILIDYPEFNLLLAKALRKRGYTGKIIQYISPTVWAWRKKRSNTLAKYFDMLLTIYPFESKCYAHTTLDVRYVGNPVKSRIANYIYEDNWKSTYTIPSSTQVIAIFPGSRTKEIQLNLPKMLAAVERLYKETPNFVIAISMTDEQKRDQILAVLSTFSFILGRNAFLVDRQHTYELMKDCYLAVAKSGTVTLELALHHKPTVVIFEISIINKLIAKYLLRIRLPYYTIANILLNKEVFPELVESNICVDQLFGLVKAMLIDSKLRNKTILLCKKVDDSLTEALAEENASKAILEDL